MIFFCSSHFVVDKEKAFDVWLFDILSADSIHLICKLTNAAAYQEATLVKRMSWKAMMDSGRDPREGNTV